MSAMNESPSAGREFVHQRLIAAPPAQVFAALLDPARLARWWGPDGFSSSFELFEPREGGRWRFVMHGPDGRDYPNESVFTEWRANERVVIEHVSGHHFFLTISFEPAPEGQTLVGWQQRFDTAEHAAQIAAIVVPANEQNLDRLSAEVLGAR
ncbi:SRPBCC family protein [Roseateles violae]|uniref:SRPBCC family protein n=1 Tax=Roseateles violae TaxID=3058042 RepID=A0ABT8DKM9_9BURK|nr:SRPBCC family protein [Pelomonas sp. PFR6]MDN3918971.1 SRPBCC family protein [Pelomonas sp. PFR6]